MEDFFVKTFDADGDFGASHAAEKFLSENGYSVGSMQRRDPRGIMKGDWVIAKVAKPIKKRHIIATWNLAV